MASAPSVAMDMSGMTFEPEGMRTLCNGTVIPRHFGSWQGHFWPGIIFICWGIWWAYASFQRYCSCMSLRQRYQAEAWYEFPFKSVRLLEPVMKIVGSIIGVSVELWLDHSAYRYLYCPKDTLWGGKFAVEHLNNWQHAANYPAFIISGIVDLLGVYLPLPKGVNQVFLGIAFSLEAFLMGTHTKHIPLDAIVHLMLYYAMVGSAILVLAEAAFPHNIMLSAGRSFFVIVKGSWLWAAATILFQKHPEWSPEYMGSSMVCPLVFAMICLTVATGLLAMFLVVQALSSKGTTTMGWPVYSHLSNTDLEACVRDDSAHESCSEDDITIVSAQHGLSSFNIQQDKHK